MPNNFWKYSVLFGLVTILIMSTAIPADAQSLMGTYLPINIDCPEQQFEQYRVYIQNHEPAYSSEYERAEDGLAYCGAKSVPILKQLFRGRRLDYGMKELSRIGLEGKDAFPEVMKLFRNRLQSKDSLLEERIGSALILGRLGETDIVIPVLLDIIQNLSFDEVEYGDKAALVLAETGANSPEVVSALVKMLQNPQSAASHSSAALALAGLGKNAKSAIPSLKEMLKYERDSLVITNLALALLTAGNDSEDLPRIITSAIFDQTTRFKAISDLGYGSELTERQLLVVSLIGDKMQSSVPTLIAALQKRELQDGQNLELQDRVIKTLAAIGPIAKDSIPALIPYIKSGDIDAIQAVGAIGTGAELEIPSLDELLLELDVQLAKEADIAKIIVTLETLGKIGKAQIAVPALLGILRTMGELVIVEPNPFKDQFPPDLVFVRTLRLINVREVGRALKQIGIPSVSYLVAALNSTDAQSQKIAAYGLSQIDQPLPDIAISLLKNTVKDERTALDTRRFAAYALEKSDIDVESFFTQHNLTPSKKAACGLATWFDDYTGRCQIPGRNGGAALYDAIRRLLCGNSTC